MPKKLPQRDPIRAHGRKVTAQRRIGVDAKCECSESRPEALVAGSNPIICAACARKRDGRKPFDDHHVAGKANSTVTIQVLVNDHRAVLSPGQRDWPPSTLENPDGSPLIAGAACIRGFGDILVYLMNALLLWIADLLEVLDAILVKKWGPKWWLNTDLKRFPPKG